MLFSATFPGEIEKLASKILHNPKRISIGLARPAYTVEHTIFPVQHHLKRKLLIRLLGQTETRSVLIFTRTKHRARNLARQLGKTGRQVTSLHGDRTQNQRTAALKGFKQGRYKIMVATDIAARGLDIEDISHVINYDMPDTADAYIHRIGRTGRAKRNGEAFTLVTPDDNKLVQKIERIMDQKIQREKLQDFDYQAAKPDYGQKNNKRSKSHNRAKKKTKQYAH
jgi:ATP-dependent RNA helicase RhlE